MRVIYGGTFDPIYFGHILIIARLASIPAVDAVHVVVAGNPYHKSATRKITDAKIRLEMVKNAVKDWPKVIVEDLEVNKTEPSYSYITTMELKSKYPEPTSWAFAHGTDVIMNGSLVKWDHIIDLLNEVDFWLINRGNNKTELHNAIHNLSPIIGNTNVEKMIKDIIDFPDFSMSSTVVRDKYAQGVDCSLFIPKQSMIKGWDTNYKCQD